MVGAGWSPEGDALPGAVHVFEWDGTGWTESQKLTADDGAPGDYFGGDVAVDGNLAVIAAPRDDGADDTMADVGAAYVYTRSDGRWTFEQKLLRPGGSFARSVSVSDGSILLGGTNGPSVYVKGDAGWVEQQQLLVLGATASFGSPVSISGDIAVAGHSAELGLRGAAYVFQRVAGLWLQARRLALPEAEREQDDRFGFSVATSGDTVVIGVLRDNDLAPSAGSAMIYSQ
jgi:hypothetical protein